MKYLLLFLISTCAYAKHFEPANKHLMAAIALGDQDDAIAIIESGTNPNTKDPQGYTPLMQAAAEGLVGVVDAILTHGGQESAQEKGPKGKNALDIALAMALKKPTNANYKQIIYRLKKVGLTPTRASQQSGTR